MTSRRAVAIGLLGAVLALGLGTALEAQPLIRLVGVVQWIAGTRMQMIMDSGASVAIDLTEADQASYQALRNGDAIIVDGVVTADRRRVLAQAIWRDTGTQWMQSP
jgi:hypothetical protein